MKMDSSVVGLLIAVASCIGLSDSVSAQRLRVQNGNRQFGGSMTRSMGSGSITFNSGNNGGRSFGSFPSTETPNGQGSISIVSGSRSASFLRNGKRVSVSESASGITVDIGGHRVKAKDAFELKKNFPESYRLYDEGLKNTRSFARASGSASGRGMAGGSTGGGRGRKFGMSTSNSRSVAVMDNGKKVNIAEDASGITVSVNGK
ncbi:MAG: hypothetical protein AAFN70_17210, partial [Planctomycetota bacterium]